MIDTFYFSAQKLHISTTTFTFINVKLVYFKSYLFNDSVIEPLKNSPWVIKPV